MKNFLATLLSELIAQKLPVRLMSLGSILASVSLWYQTYLAKFLADPTGKIALLTSTLSIIFLLLLIATYFWFKPKLVISQDDGGCWVDVKTGIRYCVSCKVTHKQLVPLTKESTRWRCPVNGCSACYWLPAEESEESKNQSRPIYG